MRQRPITLIRFVITCAALGVVVSFAFEQASAQDAKTAPAKQYGTQFNPKEYLKEDSRIKNVKVELASHPTEAGRSAQWVITPVQIKNGEFVLGVLPPGEYELRFSDVDGHSDATANRGITINTSHVEYSADKKAAGVEYSDVDKKAAGNADPKHNSDVGRLTMTLTGVVGGPLKQELKADLSSQMGSEMARAGKPKFGNVVAFKADGSSAVKGRLRHDMVKSSIQNMK